MPHEIGGRAAKFGERYEAMWVVKQLLRLVKEEIAGLTLEAIGDKEEGIDLWIREKNGSLIGSQCKSRNGSKETWAISDLGRRNIFEHAKKQLNTSEKTFYHFVSAANCLMLKDITKRARNSNNNYNDFYEYQIKSSNTVHKEYKKIMKYFGLDYKVEHDQNRGLSYLKRMHVIQFSDDIEAKRELKEIIKQLFIGNPEVIYNLLSNFVIENDLLGKEVSTYMVTSFLESKAGIYQRNLQRDDRIMPRIKVLNDEFTSSFLEINNSLISRPESDQCYKEIMNGNSIILHGKAGSGKTGCIADLLKKLKAESIVHLALKLDRRVPQKSSEHYGADLKLPASPVFCIDALSKDKEAVLVLDQLDAIRWTNNHSNTALEVCKEMISELENINKDRNKKISLVFVCRTFDFQNDNGIRQLFLTKEGKENVWKPIEVDDLDDKAVKAVVGDTYNHFHTKFKELLKTPSNLYIWTNLEEQRRMNTYITSRELIDEWWEQIVSYRPPLVSNDDFNKLKRSLMEQIDNQGRLMIPKQLVSDCSQNAIQHLLSSGLLITDGKTIGFVHQSFYDYFSVENMIRQVFEGETITSILEERAKQTPTKRYQLQMLLEFLLDYDMNDFIDFGIKLINDDNVRFYMKYVFLEVLGQSKSVNSKTELFLKDYINSEYWRDHLIDSVFIGHPTFVRFLANNGYIQEWLKTEENRDVALEIMKSINSKLPDEVTSLLTPLAFKEKKLDRKIYNTLCWDIDEDSDDMFEFRLEMINQRPELLESYFSWMNLVNKTPDRAFRLFKLIVTNNRWKAFENRRDIDEEAIKALTEVAKVAPYKVWKSFMPYIAEKTKNTGSIYDEKVVPWKTVQYMDQLYGRACIEMVKTAGITIMNKNVDELLKNSEQYFNLSSIVINEILLYIMGNLPSSHSDYAIGWLIENPHNHLFNFTGKSDDYLSSAKKIISKHSKMCSDEVFSNLERTLYYYRDENEFERAQRRFKFNSEQRKEGNKQLAYWPYWGYIQYYLMPTLDKSRITRKSYELIRILNRKFINEFNIYKRNNVISGSVSSTIGKKADLISDQNWIKIIQNTRHVKEKWSLFDEPFLESSPRKFSYDLENVGKKNPIRIARLSLDLSEDVDVNFIRAIFEVIGLSKPDKEIEGWEPVPYKLAQVLYEKWSDKTDDINVANSFCRGIESRAEEPWNESILTKISNLAMTHANPALEVETIDALNDEKHDSVHSLFSKSMNCVRGVAARTIAALLWEDVKRFEFFKSTVGSIVNDEHLGVNMAAIECIRPITKIDKEYAAECFFKLAEKDLRIIAHPYAYDLFYPLYQENTKAIQNLIVEMYNSESEDVAKEGAKHITNMYLLYGCFEEFIFTNKERTKKQKEGIVAIAISVLGKQEFHERSKEIIISFLEDNLHQELDVSLFRILDKEKLSFPEDENFILDLVTSRSNRRMIRYFVDFLNENEVSIILFKDVIFTVCKSVIKNYQHDVVDMRRELYGITAELSNLIAKLYDESKDTYDINQKCLDVWDQMFENRVGTIRELTQAIIEV